MHGSAVQARHIGFCSGFIQKDQVLRVEIFLRGLPFLTCLFYIFPILLAGF
jgi:hypothetical protein